MRGGTDIDRPRRGPYRAHKSLSGSRNWGNLSGTSQQLQIFHFPSAVEAAIKTADGHFLVQFPGDCAITQTRYCR
jgi:hypothetical protein